MSLRALPTIAIPVILYNLLVVFAGSGSAAGFLQVPLFTMKMIKGAEKMLPIFANHVLWRPKAREFVGSAMRERDIARVRREIEEGVRIASSLGLDVSDIEYTIP